MKPLEGFKLIAFTKHNYSKESLLNLFFVKVARQPVENVGCFAKDDGVNIEMKAPWTVIIK